MEKEIERIIYFKENGYPLARIDFSDGSTKIVSKKASYKYVKKLLKQENVDDVEQLKNDKILFMTIPEMEEKFGVVGKKPDKKNDEDEEEKKGFGKIILATAIFCTIALVALSIKAGQFIKDAFKTSDVKKEKEMTYDDIDEVLDSHVMSTTRKKFFESILSYLKYYNGVFSKQYYEESLGRLAHTWEEVAIQKLIFNDYNDRTLTEIFQEHHVDRTEMVNAYLSYIEQETQAHVIQTSSLNKDMLFDSDEGRIFYDRYEAYVIDFNNATDESDKRMIAEEFYNSIRSDFDLKDLDASKIKDYQLSITPIVNAMNILCADQKDIKLSKKELGYFNDRFFEHIVVNKINRITNIVNSNKNTYDDAYSYDELKDMSIKSLIDEAIYNVDEDRDITDYIRYKTNAATENTVDNKNKKDKKEEKDDEIVNTTNNGTKNTNTVHTNTIDNDNTNTNETNSEVNSNGSKTDTKENGKKKKTTNKKKKETKKTDGKKEKKGKNNDDITTNTPEPEDNNIVVPSEPTTNEIVDNDTSYDNVEDKNVITEEESEYTYVDIDDSVKDITTDPNGAYEHSDPLPDPNGYNSFSKEELATIIVDYMALGADDIEGKKLVKTR